MQNKMKTPPNCGPECPVGYRVVGPLEMLESGDCWWNPGLGEWSETVCDGDKKTVPDMVYIRQLPFAAYNALPLGVSIPSGYRFVLFGEVIEMGDKYFEGCTGKWVSTGDMGVTLRKHCPRTYIRPVQSAPKLRVEGEPILPGTVTHSKLWRVDCSDLDSPERNETIAALAKLARTPTMTLPTDSKARKELPIFRGVIRYFPAALAGVSRISKIGNDKHNPNEEMHHARAKSVDHGDCILRHMIDVEDLIKQGADRQLILDEASCLVWRALAYSQLLHEKLEAAPVAPGAK